MTKDIMFILAVIAFVATVIILLPIATIWSLNTLFSLAIPITFDTWLAAFVLSAVVSGTGVGYRRKK